MRGKVECEEADVAGSFEGMEMTAHHRLTLSGTARVGGRVSEGKELNRIALRRKIISTHREGYTMRV